MLRYFLYPNARTDFAARTCGCVCCPTAMADAGAKRPAHSMRGASAGSEDHQPLALWTILTILQLVSPATSQQTLASSPHSKRPRPQQLLLLLQQPRPLPGCLLHPCPCQVHPTAVVEATRLAVVVPHWVVASLVLSDRHLLSMASVAATLADHAQWTVVQASLHGQAAMMAWWQVAVVHSFPALVQAPVVVEVVVAVVEAAAQTLAGH
mmetsp:Transcript_103576/g.183717  ORF Transcript_103576/g.183717 Transcript_103576/m.183717 type:complete len:209 (+) Transcript_103576:419-1045(+)